MARTPGTGAVGIRGISSRFQGDFAFDVAGRPWLLDHLGTARHRRGIAAPQATDSAPELLPRPGESMVWTRGARPMPERKFLHFAFQGNADSPYGAGLCAKAYWYYWFKKNNLKFWALYNEKFGAPTAVGRYSEGTSETELERVTEILADLPRESGILLPDGVELEFLEARRSAGTNTYRDLADWCNDELSKIVLGQTLTTTEGRRSGSLALGSVHESVRRDYLASDARALGGTLTAQLSRWITDFNLGPDAPAPVIVFDSADPGDFENDLKVDRELVKMGVSLPANYFYEKYRRPQPKPGQRALRYDDANLYQYHLMFGVLTINEVRASLGLPGVAWGDVPPAGSDTTQGAMGGSRKNLTGAGGADRVSRDGDPEEGGDDGESAHDRGGK